MLPEKLTARQLCTGFEIRRREEVLDPAPEAWLPFLPLLACIRGFLQQHGVCDISSTLSLPSSIATKVYPNVD